jgi:hypothetical protein
VLRVARDPAALPAPGNYFSGKTTVGGVQAVLDAFQVQVRQLVAYVGADADHGGIFSLVNNPNKGTLSTVAAIAYAALLDATGGAGTHRILSIAGGGGAWTRIIALTAANADNSAAHGVGRNFGAIFGIGAGAPSPFITFCMTAFGLTDLDAAAIVVGNALINPANAPELEIAVKQMNAIADLVIAAYKNGTLGRLVTANRALFAAAVCGIPELQALDAGTRGADKNFCVLSLLTLIAMAEFGAVNSSDADRFVVGAASAAGYTPKVIEAMMYLLVALWETN